MQTIPTDILKHFSAVLEKRVVPATSHADYRKWLRYSQMLLPAQKETPSDAKAVSRKLMLRAGMTRKVAAGINTQLHSVRPHIFRVFSVFRGYNDGINDTLADRTACMEKGCELWLPVFKNL